MLLNIRRIGQLKISYFILVVVAISITPYFMHILPPDWRLIPSISLATLLFFALSILLEQHVWKLRPQFYGTSNLSGVWEGFLERDGADNERERVPITYTIRQSLLDIRITLDSGNSLDTRVISASIDAADSHVCLTYVYRGKNRNKATGAIDIVEGTAILYLKERKAMEGYYFTQAGRRGSIRIEKR